MTVVLDLDEMLIHSAGFSDDGKFSGKGILPLPKPDARVDAFPLQYSNGVTCTVYKRPGLDTFLRAVASDFPT